MARKTLTVAVRAFFDVATWDMKLSLCNGAVVTRHLVRMPIVTLVAVTNSREHLFPDRLVGERLRSFYFCGPLWKHFDSGVDLLPAFQAYHSREVAQRRVNADNPPLCPPAAPFTQVE